MSTATTTVSPVRTSASPADVRTFLATKGIKVGSRGRFSADQIAAFNAEHKGFAAYRPGAVLSKHVVTVEGRNAKGRKVTKAVDVSAARKVLAEQGIEIGSRGKVSLANLLAASGLTPLA